MTSLRRRGVTSFWLVGALLLGGCPEEVVEEDAAPPRRDSGLVVFDAAGGDASTLDAAVARDTGVGHDSATGVDHVVPQDASGGHDSAVILDAGGGTDSATPQDASVATDSASTTDAGTTQDAATTGDAGSGLDVLVTTDAAAAGPGRGELCQPGQACRAPLTCVVPQGATEGFCLEACSGAGSCSGGRTTACQELHPTVPGTYCLDVGERGDSCFEVYDVCNEGSECFVTDRDEQGNPTAALCKENCVVGAQPSTCPASEGCVESGYVSLEEDDAGEPIICEQDPGVCGGDFECMQLQTSDGRPVNACAQPVGWCGAQGGNGDTCDEDQDLYCGELTGEDLAFSLCFGVCVYVCYVPGEYTGGAPLSLGCPDSLDCVDGPPGFYDGVKICEVYPDGGFPTDAGTADASQLDAGSPIDSGAGDSAASDAAVADVAPPDSAGTDASSLPDAVVQPDAGPACPPCDGLDFIGECSADTLRWCDSDGCLRQIDCASYENGNGVLHCAELNSDWGYDCLAGLGQPCDPVYPPTGGIQNRAPGCDPAQGSCNPITFVCQASGDGGVVGVDAGGGGDAGTPCPPCGQVDGLGTCSSVTELQFCTQDDCLLTVDCTGFDRHCSHGTVVDGQDQFEFYDCMGSTGQACQPDFDQHLQEWPEGDFLCDPQSTGGCSTQSLTCQ